MKAIDDKKETTTIRAVSGDEEGRKRVEKIELPTNKPSAIKYAEKKLVDKGVLRRERHPADGISGVGKPPPKSGHGGKFTWEGPAGVVESLQEPAPAAIDEGDPNYVGAGEDDDVAPGLVVGEVDVVKVAEGREGVSRVDVDPRLTRDNLV